MYQKGRVLVTMGTCGSLLDGDNVIGVSRFGLEVQWPNDEPLDELVIP